MGAAGPVGARGKRGSDGMDGKSYDPEMMEQMLTRLNDLEHAVRTLSEKYTELFYAPGNPGYLEALEMFKRDVQKNDLDTGNGTAEPRNKNTGSVGTDESDL